MYPWVARQSSRRAQPQTAYTEHTANQKDPRDATLFHYLNMLSEALTACQMSNCGLKTHSMRHVGCWFGLDLVSSCLNGCSALPAAGADEEPHRGTLQSRKIINPGNGTWSFLFRFRPVRPTLLINTQVASTRRWKVTTEQQKGLIQLVSNILK